jgi:hypothetical protein
MENQIYYSDFGTAQCTKLTEYRGEALTILLLSPYPFSTHR